MDPLLAVIIGKDLKVIVRFALAKQPFVEDPVTV
jgi:hypothetical protein